MAGQQEPHYGEKTDQEPTYAADAEKAASETSGTETSGTDRLDGTQYEDQNQDLHGQAREVADSGSGPGPGKTPAG